MVQDKKDALFTKEEELLLQDFNRNVSTGSNMLFYGSAAIVSALPICKQNSSTSSIEIS
jgi:Translocon-associated protein, gamma subunit (TRAP-gamma)